MVKFLFLYILIEMSIRERYYNNKGVNIICKLTVIKYNDMTL